MTDIITAMENRHAVRVYDPEKKIPKEITDKLRRKDRPAEFRKRTSHTACNR